MVRPEQQQSSGVLRPHPQAYTASGPAPTSTNIEAVVYTLGLNPPDSNWYMDTGATSHMTSRHGNLSSYFRLSKSSGILVGNGNSIPICGYGHAPLPSPNPPLT